MISSSVVLDPDRLSREVEYFGNAGAFVWDVETIDSGPGSDDRGVPHRNVTTWVSMATHGRTIVIPMGHPIGTRQVGETKEPRADKNGKIRMFRVPVYEKPPEQMTRSDVFPELNKLFADPDVKQAAHGATFDAASVAKYRAGQIPAGDIFCTIVMRWLTDENRKRYGLKYITKELYKVGYDDESVGRQVEKHPFGRVAHYAYLDAKFSWLEYKKCMRRIEEEGLRDLLQLETDLTSVLANMRTTGVPINVERLHELRDEMSARVETDRRSVFAAAGREFNLNAPRQKQEVLFKPKSEGGQGLKPWKLTDGGKKKKESGQTPDFTFYSTDDDSLQDFRETNQVVDKLLNYQESNKVLGTYIMGYLGNPEEKDKPCRVFDGRVYPDLVQYAAATGRTGCRAPNIQNIPAPRTDLGTMIRELFAAPPGYLLVGADYGQVELVILADLAFKETGKKGALWRGFHDGVDPHTMTAAMVLHKDPADVTKNERQRFGKSLNFAVVYGAGAAKVGSMAGVSTKEAKELLATYDQQFPEVKALRTKTLREARRLRPPHSTTIMGRKRRLPTLNSSDDGLRMYAERQAFNSRVQGSSADITKLAMVRYDRMKKDSWTLLMSVHDEIVTLAPEDEAEEARDVLVEAMTGPEMQELLTVPLTCDPGIARNWALLK